jgi:hypothetical protein
MYVAQEDGTLITLNNTEESPRNKKDPKTPLKK